MDNIHTMKRKDYKDVPIYLGDIRDIPPFKYCVLKATKKPDKRSKYKYIDVYIPDHKNKTALIHIKTTADVVTLSSGKNTTCIEILERSGLPVIFNRYGSLKFERIGADMELIEVVEDGQ